MGTLNFQLLDDGSALATLQTVDSKGNPIPFPTGASVPSYTASDPSVTVAPAADGMTATITDTGVIVAGVTITASSTLADGTTVISGSALLDVVADAAKPTGFKVTLSTPAAS